MFQAVTFSNPGRKGKYWSVTCLISTFPPFPVGNPGYHIIVIFLGNLLDMACIGRGNVTAENSATSRTQYRKDRQFASS